MNDFLLKSPPYYLVRNGRGYWQPNRTLRRQGSIGAVLMSDNAREIFDDFPNLPTEGEPEYCGRSYWEWEDKVCKPALEAAGHTRVRFRMIEQDSFGPLIRGIRADKDGKTHSWFYG